MYIKLKQVIDHHKIALKYTKPLHLRTISTLKDGNGNTTVFIKAKEILVQKSTFLNLPTNLEETSVTFS